MIRFDSVSVTYGATTALCDFTLEVARGETVALLGPSGSGKSTALKAVAGFVRPSSGRVLLDGRDVTDEPPHRRGIGVVVQNYALFPHMRVFDNVAFGLRARRLPRAEIAERVGEVLAMVGMDGYRDRMPGQLSGGQQQRVAIARALAIRPPVLLLDEPLSALDAGLRQELLGELQALRRELPDVAILYVTHDQNEALALADRIAIMRDAALVDADTSDALYRRPPSAFTAAFLGGANLLPGTVLSAGPAGVRVRAGGREITAAGPVASGPAASPSAGEPALVCVRPHALRTAPHDAPDALPGVLTGTQWRGASYRLTVRLDDGPESVVADVPTLEGTPAPGGRIGLRVDEAVLVPVPGDSPPAVPASRDSAPGAPVPDPAPGAPAPAAPAAGDSASGEAA